jgi:hypothetical protein
MVTAVASRVAGPRRSGAGGQVLVEHGAQGLGEAGAGASVVFDAVDLGAGLGVRVAGGDQRGAGEVVQAAFDAGQAGAGVAGAEGQVGAVARVGRFEVAVGVKRVEEFLGDPAQVDRIHLGGVCARWARSISPATATWTA